MMSLLSSRLHPKHVTLLFFACLLVFIILKIPHVQLAFFWDELGVYGHMSYELADHHLTLHPGAINEWVSKGHPLLYVNFIALALKIFGINPTVAHSANLFLAVMLLVVMYFQIAKLASKFIALVTCVLLMVLHLFFTQAALVLPEIALTLCLWMATWAFIQKQWIAYVLTASAALLIKEPAIIWIAALLAWRFLSEPTNTFREKVLMLLPFVPFLIFLLVQHQAFGWYFFPSHTVSLNTNPANVFHNLTDYVRYLTWSNGRFVLTVLTIAGILWMCVLKIKGQTTGWPKVSLGYYAAVFAPVMYLLFCCATFSGLRYIFPIIPFFFFGVAYILHQYTFKRMEPIIGVVLIGFCVLTMFRYQPKKFNYDNDMFYTHSISSGKRAVQYMLDNGMLNELEYSATMPIIFATIDNRFGYLPQDTTARGSRAITHLTKYVVQVIPGTPVENAENYPLDTIIQWKDGDIRTIIYKVLPKDTITIQK